MALESTDHGLLISDELIEYSANAIAGAPNAIVGPQLGEVQPRVAVRVCIAL
jgi:hypothetical protein